MIRIERITPERALVFKEVRLRALLDSPMAFSSTYAKEAALPDEEWQRRSARWSSDGSAGFLAFEDEVVCGIVFCFAEEQDPMRAHVVSMWVDPKFRRKGVGRGLIGSVVEWARSHGMRELRLMVTSVNHSAIAFYERLGFRMTGETEPYPNDLDVTEHEMVLALD